MGFGGGSNKAAAAAEQQERDRQAQIKAAQGRVESIFSSPDRERQIQDLTNATRSYLQDDLLEQRDDTARNIKFAVARSGLGGGSVQIDQGRELAEDFLKGILEVERRSNTAGATLRSQDQATKSGLFQQILGGLDATTAAQQASQSMQQNVALAKSDSLQSGLGDLFGNFGELFKLSREGAGERRAAYDFGSPYAQRPTNYGTIAGGVYG